MSWLAIPALLVGCPHADDDGPPPPTDETAQASTGDTGAWPWPIWIYQSSLETRTTDLTAVDGAAALRVDGYTWGLLFGGPTLVAELEHEIRFTIANQTEEAFPFTWPGVELVDSPVIPPAGSATDTFRTTMGPGVYVGKASEDTARRGAFSLITIRDPAVFPVEDLDFQLNLVLVDTPVANSQVDACRFDAATTAECPAWRPAVAGETTALLPQRVFKNPSQMRHGAGPNEFLTVTVRSFDVTPGSNVRFNLASLAEGPHTIGLGGLSAVDPTGAVVTQVTLEPGQTTWLLVEGIGPAGELELGCIDHDHHGLGLVSLVLQGG